MINPQFDVVLKGVLSGFDPQQVQIDFAALFSLDAEKTARLFAAQRAVLKSSVNEDTANKYIARLASIGVAAVAEAIAVVDAGLSLVPIAEETKPHEDVHQPDEPHASYSEPSSESASSDYSDSGVYTKTTHRMLFSGSGFEYFKIWIVNLLLTIVTVGIYSAWAKVRNKQYFYGNTHIADASFEYTAEPLKILKGRLIAFALYIGVFVSQHISHILSLVLGLALLLFLPWIVVNSLKFNARHTSYRNISFRFHGTIGGALKAFILWPFVGMFSLGILMPFVWKKQVEYITNNHAYGAQPFDFHVSVKEYYKLILLLIGGAVVLMTVCGVLVGGTMMTAISGAATGGSFNPAMLASLIPAMIVYILGYFALGAFFVVGMVNIHFNNTMLQNHQFESSWSVLSYMGLVIVNTLAILLTLGLFIPFAKVRAAAYRADHTALVVRGNLDNFIVAKREESNSLGEGVHDIFDIDISL